MCVVESVSNTDANGDCVKGSSLDESNLTQLNDSSKSVKGTLIS